MSGGVCPLVLVNISYRKFGKDFQSGRGDDQNGGNVEKQWRWFDGWDYAVARNATVLVQLPSESKEYGGRDWNQGFQQHRTVISQSVFGIVFIVRIPRDSSSFSPQ
jgi:hypothetical protein